MADSLSLLSPPEQAQGISSAKTSRAQVAMGLRQSLKLGLIKKGSNILDFGGGKFDVGADFVEEAGASLSVYDPFNRSYAHNEQVKSRNDYHTFICNNVLNVLERESDIVSVLRDMLAVWTRQAVNPIIVFTVYVGNWSNVGSKTRDGYQRNETVKTHFDRLARIFSKSQWSVSKIGQLIVLEFAPVQ